MSWPDDQSEGVAVKFYCCQFPLLRQVGNHSDIQLMIQHLARNVARKYAMDANLDSGVCLPVAVESRKQGMDRAFVHADGHLAALEAAQFLHALADLLAEIEHAVGILEEQHAGIRQGPRAGSLHEERLAHPVLELAHGYTHRRLCAIELFRRAGKAAFVRHRLKYL